MAKGKKTGGRNWGKGESGNKAGYQGLTDVQLLKHRTRDEILKSMCSLLTRPMREVEAIANNMKKGENGPEVGDEKCADVLMASVIAAAVVKGCPSRLNYMFQHIIGRPQTVEEIDVEAAELARREQKAQNLPDIAALIGDALPTAQPQDLLQLFQLIQRMKVNAAGSPVPVA
jgi:hypothetical protein